MTREQYNRRKQRSRKVSILTGVFGVLVFIIAVFIFLWNYWLKDVFRVADRIDMPGFIGRNYNDIINDRDFSIFNFKVVYALDPEAEEGVIIGQTPEEGRSMMIVSDGIDVELSVATGIMMTEVPDVTNWQYQEAVLELQKTFEVETVIEASDTVTKDYVIKTSPQAGEQLAAGNTIFVTISGGPEVKTVSMPNLVGLDEASAKSRLESNNLSLASVTRISSAYDAGVVFRQSVAAYSEIEEHSQIYLWVSTGPEPTPTPTPTPTEAPPVLTPEPEPTWTPAPTAEVTG